LLNLQLLRPQDEVKFVIASRNDYEWARRMLSEHQLAENVASVLMSPAFGVLNPQLLAEWILEDRLPVRLQLQLNKYIWEPTRRGV